MISGRVRELSNLQFALLLALPVLVFLILVVAYPLGYAVWLSVNQVMFFGGYRTSFVGGEHFVDTFLDGKFWESTWISVRFTIETVVLTILIGLGLALVLNRPFPGRNVVRTLVVLPWALSLYATAIMFSYIGGGHTGVGTAIAFALGFDEPVNFMNKDWIIEFLAIGSAWNLAPLVAFFLMANLSTVPRRLYDLADLDHLSTFEKFYNVTLPPLRFTLFVFTCIATVLALKQFDYIYVMTGGGPGRASAVLTYEIYKISFQNLDLGPGAARSFFLLALILGSTIGLYFLWGRREAARP